MNRRPHLDRLYALLTELRRRIGGYYHLQHCHGRMGWPRRGVYFFFEHGEARQGGHGLRVVRVGTHAVSASARTTLWQRLAQHRGRVSGPHAGVGNHRGSVFRLHVGTALLNSRPYPDGIRATWGTARAGSRSTREQEHPLEQDVSAQIRHMPFLWLAVSDEPGRTSDRKVIEAGAVALLSNRGREPVDPPSPGWLGRYAAHPAVRESGLWNVDHVDEPWDPAFLAVLERYVQAMLQGSEGEGR